MSDVTSLLPPNASATERAIEQAVGRISVVPVPLREVKDAATCPQEALPALAWEWSVDEWHLAEVESEQRAAIADSYRLHALKGTPWAVRRAIALAGLGNNSRLIEGHAPRLYDGTIFADGSQIHGGWSWAEYTIEADLGEHSGLDASTPDRVRRAATAAAPASRHLTSITWAAHVDDDVPSSDEQQTAVRFDAADITPWRRRYDGTLHCDQGSALTYSGATLADGSALFQGWSAQGAIWLAGEEESDIGMAMAVTSESRVQRLPLYDGATQADGATDYGDSAPACEDAPMVISITRHRLFDGRHRYATALFDGVLHADGASTYTSGLTASGPITTYLEAA